MLGTMIARIIRYEPTAGGDIINTFKISRGLTRVNSEDMVVQYTKVRPKSNGIKPRWKQCRTKVRDSFFIYRVVDTCNTFSEELVASQLAKSFKAPLERNWEKALPEMEN